MKIPLFTMLKYFFGIILAIVAVDLIRARRFFVKSNQDPTIDAEIKVFSLDGDPGKRVIPEWEPAPGVLISYPFLLPYAMLCELALDHKLYIMARNDRQAKKCLKKLTAHDIKISNVEFIFSQRSYSHPWTRDWGPYTLKTKADLQFVDAHFRNYPISGYDSQKKKLRWLTDVLPFLNTKHDNDAPAAVADHLKLKRKALSIALTGGSALFDGQGTLFICRIVIDENKALGHSFDEFKQQLATHLGIKRLIVLPNYRRLGIQHIDCLLKLLDENRILLKRLDPSHPDHQRVKLIAGGLSQLKTLDGKIYEIIRIDTPNYAKNKSAPYTNALIFNRKIFVPIKGIPGDEEALNTWEAAMPGYKVFGFRVEKWMRPWNYTDAVHCRTKAIFLN